MSVPIVQSLSRLPAPPAALALDGASTLAGVPASLIWAIAILTFGILLMVCVLLLLKRESEPVLPWGQGAGADRGRHLQHLNRLLRAIRAINSLILAERDGSKLLEKACRSLTTTRGYRMAWIGLIEEGTKRVDPVTQAGFENGYLEQITVTWDDAPTGQGPTGRALKTGEPSVMRDIQSAVEFEPWREQALERGYRSSAALPLRFEGNVLGALNVYSEMPDAFDIEEVGLLQEVADHLAYALGSIRLEAELAEARRETEQWRHIGSALERASVGIIVTDGEGIITGINRRMMGFLNGYETPEEVINRVRMATLDIFSEAAARACLDELLARGRPVRFECHPPGADGRPRTLSCRGLPLLGEGAGPKEAVWMVEEAGHRPAPSVGTGRMP